MALLACARARGDRSHGRRAARIYAALAGELRLLRAARGRGARAAASTRTSRPLPPTADGARHSARGPTCRARVKLAELDLRPESQREWSYDRARPRRRRAAAWRRTTRSAQGCNDRAINTAEPHARAPRLRAALPDAVPRLVRGRGARQRGRPGACCSASRARNRASSADIVSSAGAVGLMQLMPATARWVAKQLGRTDYRPSQIDDVDINTQFGAFYFKYWLDRLDAPAGARRRRV